MIISKGIYQADRKADSRASLAQVIREPHLKWYLRVRLNLKENVRIMMSSIDTIAVNAQTHSSHAYYAYSAPNPITTTAINSSV